jgi:hypothetical protein
LPLAIVMMSVLMLFAFGTPLLQQQQSADAFKLDQGGHYGITERALPFLTPIVLHEINQGHHVADLGDIRGGAISARQHFDNCKFRDGTKLINEYYNQILKTPPEKLPFDKDVRIKFGRILHAAQDFYSHTNWVELGFQPLVDPMKDRLWKEMTGGVGGTYYPNVFVGDGAYFGNAWKLTFYPKSLTAFATYTDPGNPANKRTYWALISGLVPYELDGNNFVTVNCPIGARTGHWPHTAGHLPGLISPGRTLMSVITPGTPGLAKDNSPGAGDNANDPKFLNHFTAKRRAEEQTYNEFCRLLNLVEKKHGLGTKMMLADIWITYNPKIPGTVPGPPGTDPRQGDDPRFFHAIRDCPNWAYGGMMSGPAAPLDQSKEGIDDKLSETRNKAIQDKIDKTPPAQLPPPSQPTPSPQPQPQPQQPPDVIIVPGDKGSGSSRGGGGGKDGGTIEIPGIDELPGTTEPGPGTGIPGETPPPPNPGGDTGVAGNT